MCYSKKHKKREELEIQIKINLKSNYLKSNKLKINYKFKN